MSVAIAARQRSTLYLGICGLLLMVAAVTAVSARDPSGVSLRIGMVLMVVGVSFWLPWQAILPAALGIWIAPNLVRSSVDEYPLFGTEMMLELPGILGLALFCELTRRSLRRLESESLLIGATRDDLAGIDPDTGIYEERLLVNAIEGELVRSRRFDRRFALVLVGIDDLHKRFDYRDKEDWSASFNATAKLLLSTRVHIDRVYRYGATGFALLLPESSEREVNGLLRRLRRVARHAVPAEGQPGGPLPVHFGATFFPTAATTTEDLLRRAEVALRLAEKSQSRIQFDGAAAPEMEPPETRRQDLVPDTDDVDAASEPTVPAIEPTPIAAIEAQPAAPVATLSTPALVESLAEVDPAIAASQTLRVVEPDPAAPAPGEAESAPSIAAASEAPLAESPQRPFEPVLVASQPEEASSEQPSQPDSAPNVDDLFKRLDETLDLLHSLRTNNKAS